MSATTSTLFHRSSPLKGLGRTIVRLTRRAGTALQVRAERRYLMGFDEAALKDMGLNKGQAYNEASRPFWDIPIDRIR